MSAKRIWTAREDDRSLDGVLAKLGGDATVAATEGRAFINGVRAATKFVIDMSHANGVPRNADQAKQFVLARQAAASPSTATPPP